MVRSSAVAERCQRYGGNSHDQPTAASALGSRPRRGAIGYLGVESNESLADEDELARKLALTKDLVPFSERFPMSMNAQPAE